MPNSDYVSLLEAPVMLRRFCLTLWRSWQALTSRGIRQAGRHNVIMYTRINCHLCDTAWQQLQDHQQRYGFTLTKIDVDTDSALLALHGMHVPVVAINGKVRFRGHVNPILLKRLLLAKTR